MSERDLVQVPINITEDHERYGNPHNFNECAVALAIGDVLKPGYQVSVDNYLCEIYDEFGESYYWVELPVAARLAVLDFDNRAPIMGDREFTLSLPSEVVD